MLNLRKELLHSTAPPADGCGASSGDVDERLLSTAELAARWGCSRKKLVHDRMAGRGIPFVAIGRLRRYRLTTILEFEHAQSRFSTSDEGGHDAGAR